MTIAAIILLLTLFSWGIYKLVIYFLHKRPKFIITYLDDYNKYVHHPKIPKKKPEFKIGSQRLILPKWCNYFFDRYDRWYFVDHSIPITSLRVKDKVVIFCLGKYYLMEVDRKEHNPELYTYDIEYKIEGEKELIRELMWNSNYFKYIGKVILKK